VADTGVGIHIRTVPSRGPGALTGDTWRGTGTGNRALDRANPWRSHLGRKRGWTRLGVPCPFAGS
jgi:hypothetical protein